MEKENVVLQTPLKQDIFLKLFVIELIKASLLEQTHRKTHQKDNQIAIMYGSHYSAFSICLAEICTSICNALS